MIIMLNDDIGDAETLSRPMTQAAIESLYISMGRGEHYVLASRSLLHAILNANVNSVNVKAILSWCLQNYVFLAGLPKLMSPGLIVIAEGEISKLNDTCWQVPIDEIARTGVRPVVLLAENSVDARIFKHAAKHYLISKKLGQNSVSIEDRNGNGSGIAAELQNLLGRRVEWCLCIPDSDRRCPEGTLGVNAQQCEAVAAKADWPMSFRTTSGRELENDIPRTALDNVVAARVADWEQHSQNLAAVCGDILPFADIKKGVRPCDVKGLPVGTKERRYWTSVVDLYANSLPEDERCGGGGQCNDVRGCLLLPPSGEGVGTAVLDLFDRESSHSTYKMHKCSDNFTSWLELGGEVARQGFAPRRMRL